MMAPNLRERSVPNDLSLTFSSEEDSTVTLSNQTNDSADKTNNNTNSQCSSMSDTENYECYGEGELNNSGSGENIAALGSLDLKRNTWQRTSLRRSQNAKRNSETIPNRRWGSFKTSGKRIGSNALASQLYRSSSFNSSGRSSTCDTTTDDVYSDVSLEEDVLDLNHKVQMLQQQMNVLADNQAHSDERYTRAKQENAALQARVIMLEEQLREVELRSEEKLVEAERRHKELVARVDREKQLQVENCAIRLQTLEAANDSLKEEAARCRQDAEMQRREKERLQEQLEESQHLVSSLKEEIQSFKDRERKQKEEHSTLKQVLEDLNREVDILKREKNFALTELQDCKDTPSEIEMQLQSQLECLRSQHNSLQESYEELQALMITRGIEEGRTLLTGSNSLAAELEQMTNEDIKTALKEQQEVNSQLRTYIDNILLNIVENYPQLLEVKKPNV